MPQQNEEGHYDPSRDPLHPDRILAILLHVVPSQNTLKSPADFSMAFFHAAMLALGFRFLGLGEEKRDYDDAGASDVAFPRLPSDWNATGDSFSFRYSHPQSSFTFLLKGVKMMDKLIVHAVGIEDGTLHTIELSTKSYISSEFRFPYTLSSEGPPPEIPSDGAVPTATAATTALRNAFASDEQLYEVLREFRVKIVQKLIPGLNKPGYEEWKPSSSSTASGSRTTESQQPRFSASDYGHPLPRVPGAFGSGEGSSIPFPRGPFSVGDVDLDPLGIAPGMVPPSQFHRIMNGRGGGMHPGGGMFVGPDHPMFGGGGGGVPYPGGGGGPLAGPDGSRLPPGAVPPGARFDPIMPFGGGGPRGPFGGSGRGSGPGSGSGGGFGGFGGSSGEPDNDELPPPPPDNYDMMFM
ncbi:PI31 proteasome regulator N-terminal-domain-containing protein [Phlyctochytrium arcticum]|nr:PI31 proteasome regulator N-terminal-domain-containing protein [Phlyctochytrium arcticum]